MLSLVKNYEENGEAIIEKLDIQEAKVKKLLKAKEEIDFLNKSNIILKNWNIAYSFFEKNIFKLLIEPINYDFIIYQIKIILSAGYEFYETTSKYLSKLYPTKIEGELILKEISSKIYDENFSYRLCYNLRNCVQHVGTQGIIVKVKEDVYSKSYKVVLNKQKYIDEHSGIQPKFKEELLRNTNQNFDLESIIKLYNKNINEIYELIKSKTELTCHSRELYSGLDVKGIFDDIAPDNLEQYFIGNIEPKNDSLNAEFYSVNFKNIINYVDIHCKYFIMQGDRSNSQNMAGFPSQINDKEYYSGEEQINNERLYIKSREIKKDDKEYIIYLWVALPPEVKEQTIKTVMEYLRL